MSHAVDTFIPDVPAALRTASILTDYAVATRYPGWGKPVTVEEYQEALAKSLLVFQWAKSEMN